MKLNPYLTFNGNCEEAFEHYKSVFGGEFSAFQRFGEMPEGAGPPDGEPNNVMHVSLPIADGVLMGSDTSTHYGNVTIGGNFSISIAPDSKEQADQIFAGLAKDGQVTMPLSDTFWGAYFGMCRDQFGIAWMINFVP